MAITTYLWMVVAMVDNTLGASMTAGVGVGARPFWRFEGLK